MIAGVLAFGLLGLGLRVLPVLVDDGALSAALAPLTGVAARPTTPLPTSQPTS